MKTHTTKTAIWTRALLLLPLFAVLIYSCSTKEELQMKQNSKEIAFPDVKNDEIIEVVEDKDDNSTIDTETEPATPTMITEYNKIAKMYRSVGITKANVEQLERLWYIYSIMTPEQRETAEMLPPPPPPNIDFPLPTAPPSILDLPKSPPPPPAPQSPAPDKKLVFSVFSEQEIVVNGQKTNLRGFAKSIDEATKNWTTADYNLHGLEIQMSEDVPEEMIGQLNAELRKTRLANYSNNISAYFRPLTYPDSPPPPPNIESYLTEDSKIYLDGKIISAEKALELLKTKRDELKISIQQNGENNTIITMEQRE